MFSVPLICSSSGVATVSAMVWGLAPGNCAVTTTDGGTTSGYSEIGSWVMAIRPVKKMMTEITAAKIGRSIKNFDKFTSESPRGENPALGSVGGGLDRLRRDRCAGRQFLQPVQDHAIAGLEARRHHTIAGHGRAERDFAIFRLVAGADHEDEALALVA